VDLALQRAVVHVAAGRTLEEFVEFDDVTKDAVRGAAQELLDRVGAGLRLATIGTPIDPTPPLPIKKIYGALGEARARADTMVVEARDEANRELIRAAGDSYQEVVELIEAYESLVSLGEGGAAEAKLAEINAWLERSDSSADVSKVIEYARSFRAEIDGSLGVEARRFASLKDQYLAHPQLVVDRLWLGTYRRVVGQPDAEIIYVPADIAEVTIAIAGQEHIREKRRDMMLRREEDRSAAAGIDVANPDATSVEENERRLRGQPGRTLTRTGKALGSTSDRGEEADRR
jgi:hypothetical protein